MKLNFNKEPFIVIRPVCNNMLTSSATSLPVVSVIKDKTFIHSKFKKSTEAVNATKVNNLSPKKINNQSDVNIIESSQLGEGLKNKIEVKEDLINVVEKDSLGLSMDHSISGVTKLSNKMSTENTNSNLENTEMLQDDVIVVKEVINCATSHRIKLNGNSNTTANTASIFPTDSFVGNPLPTSSLASCYTGESAFVLSKSEFSDLVATPLTPSLPTMMPLSFSVSLYNSLPTSTTTLTSSTTTTPMFPSLLNSTSVLLNQQKSTLLETSQIASEKGYTELVKSENSKAPKYSRLFPQNEEMILKKISASKTTNSTQLNANANELSSTWSNQFIKCTSISNDDDSPTDLSMKTMKKLEEESLLKMMLHLEQSEPLDLSKKVPKEEYNCGFANVSKDCQQQQPLDLTKTPRQPDKDFKPNVTLPMNLTHLLPLAFAMPFSSSLQVSPRQILSPIQQNINMIYNPGSINFPILSFNPTSSCASVKP
ncbi:hypothetical protein HELRODRAFT_187773 [Helobdella robusta]|uniref:Uncharacterized protein n=1 Tax=Helobdella robusta TaxID=6412 RepID=T1FPD1_HELRO|nr:hypothetical protein HELRODRAFT_187773 [Helobdella robusta]ESO11986.1 hypothetical protein HELRODRAFT_187773 [Helobdella robusta]